MFDTELSKVEAYSHRTRIRAYLPRILAAYDTLDSNAQLTTALAAVKAIRRSGFDMATVAERLHTAGWELRDNGFVVQSPETREMFFPKGSPWDAFVLLRDLWVANYYSARNPLRLSSLVILGVVARMFRCATRSSCWCT